MYISATLFEIIVDTRVVNDTYMFKFVLGLDYVGRICGKKEG